MASDVREDSLAARAGQAILERRVLRPLSLLRSTFKFPKRCCRAAA